MITHLAQIALVEQSRLTRIIVQMEERGLVQRANDPSDGRRVRIYLSDAGRSLITSVIPEARAHEQALLAQLGEDGGTALKQALHRLLETLAQHKGGDN